MQIASTGYIIFLIIVSKASPKYRYTGVVGGEKTADTERERWWWWHSFHLSVTGWQAPGEDWKIFSWRRKIFEKHENILATDNKNISVSVMEMFTSSLLLVLALSWPATSSSYLDNSTLQLLINNQLTDSGNHKYCLTLTIVLPHPTLAIR